MASDVDGASAACGPACAIDAQHVLRPESGESSGAGNVQVSARTDGDLIVFFDAPSELAASRLIGRIVSVRVDATDGLGLHGQVLA